MSEQNETRTFKAVIDGTVDGYENDIARSKDDFFGDHNPKPEKQQEANIAVSAIPNKNGFGLLSESEIIEVNGFRVKYRKVPTMLYNTARATMRLRMKQNEPMPQQFIADKDGTRILGDQNPAYIEAVEEWRKEWADIDNLVSTGVSLLSGMVLVDGMPDESEWLPYLKMLFEASGLDFDKVFNSYLYNVDTVKEIYFKQFVVLSNSDDLDQFTKFQNTGELKVVANEATASATFRTQT